jgi:hypothetical protein
VKGCDDLEESGVGRRPILKCVLNKEGKRVEWARFVQISDQCHDSNEVYVCHVRRDIS